MENVASRSTFAVRGEQGTSTNCLPGGRWTNWVPGCTLSESPGCPWASGPSVSVIGPGERATNQEARWAGTFRRTPDIRRSSNG